MSAAENGPKAPPARNKRKGRKNMYDLIIIGSGPAGLSAAVYGRRAGFSTLVIEKNPMSGGQVLNTYEVDNYLGLPGINGFDMGMKFREHAEKMQAEFVEADVTGIRDEGDYKTVLTDGAAYEGRAVIIASGAMHSHLGVPERRSWPEWAYPTAPPVTGHFSGERRWPLWAAGMWPWRMPFFLREPVKRCI